MIERIVVRTSSQTRTTSVRGTNVRNRISALVTLVVLALVLLAGTQLGALSAYADSYPCGSASASTFMAGGGSMVDSATISGCPADTTSISITGHVDECESIYYSNGQCTNPRSYAYFGGSCPSPATACSANTGVISCHAGWFYWTTATIKVVYVAQNYYIGVQDPNGSYRQCS